MTWTRLPNQTIEACPTPKELMPAIVELRNAALQVNNFEFAVILSHVHVWLFWIDQNYEELNKK